LPEGVKFRHMTRESMFRLHAPPRTSSADE
jgi:hypothetical protein